MAVRYVQVRFDAHLLTHSVNGLPANKHFHMESDGVGCDFGNNWNSLHYGKKKVSLIRLELRSYRDSFIAASAFTESCSNDYQTDNKCFGPIRREEQHSTWISIHISFAVLVTLLLIHVLIRVKAKCDYKRAVKQSYSNPQEPLVKANV